MADTLAISTPWALNTEEILTVLSASADGLTSEEADKRLQVYGENLLLVKKQKKAFNVFLSQFKNWLIMVLVFASLISFVLGEKVNSLIILFTVGLSALFGFFQEYRAQKTLEKLNKYISHKSSVLRDGKWQEIRNELLVVGDIVELCVGDRVPADIRLLEADNLEANEAILTGESASSNKQTAPIASNLILPHDQINLVFAGTNIFGGRGKGVVYAVGKDTCLGKTAQIIGKENIKTDFEIQLRRFSQFVFKIILVMVVFVFIANAFLGKGVLSSLLFAVALAVGLTPELLPMIMTVTLSEGALVLAQKKVVVKKLGAVQNLGNMDILCTDKTGTLTEGVFSLKNYFNFEGESKENVFLKALLCTNNFIFKNKVIPVSPIDEAIWKGNQGKIKDEAIKKYSLLDENAFDFDRKRVSVLVKERNKNLLISKGSLESLLSICSFYENKGKKKILDGKKKKEIEKCLLENEEKGFRVIVVAEKITPLTKITKEDEAGMTFLGYLLFEDPVKKTAAQSLDLFKKLGVSVKIISGDSPVVVKKVAAEVGLVDDKVKILTGDEISNFGEEELRKMAMNYNLFARITPEQKYRIVSSLNTQGHVVGFLGDGVNDAPALKAADVGIAVNSGSEIAKEAADVVLLRKDLSVLEEGMLAGRKTFGNVTKYILNTISANYGNMFTVAISSLFIPFLPLLPVQILLNNFISDIPLLGIARDNVDEEFTKNPRRWNIKNISRFMVFFGLISSFFDLATILPLLFFWKVNPETFRTAWFIESSLSEMLVTFAIRTEKDFYKSKPSRSLLRLSAISMSSVVLLPFLGFGKNWFEFTSLPKGVTLWIILILITYFVTTEIVKRAFFKKFRF